MRSDTQGTARLNGVAPAQTDSTVRRVQNHYTRRAGRSAARARARVPVARHPRVRTHSVLPLGSGRGMCRRRLGLGLGGRPTPIETIVPWHVRVMVPDHAEKMRCPCGARRDCVVTIADYCNLMHTAGPGTEDSEHPRAGPDIRFSARLSPHSGYVTCY